MAFELKRVIQNALGVLGYELRVKLDPFAFCGQYGCKTVLDIGADWGSFALGARSLYPDAVIHSFEPLPKSYAALMKTMAGDAKFHAHNLALGDRDGHMEINQNEFAASSSMLPLAKAHIASFAEARVTTSVTVEQTTLDAWASHQELTEPLMVKMDVQGYEDRVLRGGQATLSRASVLITEVSFVTLFEGQVLFDSLLQAVRALGFRCSGITNILLDRNSGRPLQGDLICDRGAST